MPDKITPIQQVREALEASINMDSPMECYPDECNEGCAYMPDCVSKKILDALQILQGKVLVDEKRLEELIEETALFIGDCPRPKQSSPKYCEHIDGECDAAERTECWKAYLQGG